MYAYPCSAATRRSAYLSCETVLSSSHAQPFQGPVGHLQYIFLTIFTKASLRAYCCRTTPQGHEAPILARREASFTKASPHCCRTTVTES